MLLRQTLPKGTPIYDLLDHRVWLVGGGGVDLEGFFLRPPRTGSRDFLTFHLAEA
jgi:hypothetical protein